MNVDPRYSVSSCLLYVCEITSFSKSSPVTAAQFSSDVAATYTDVYLYVRNRLKLLQSAAAALWIIERCKDACLENSRPTSHAGVVLHRDVFARPSGTTQLFHDSHIM